MPQESQIQVRFKSRKEIHAVPETPILVPTRLRRYGLSEIINHLLGTGTSLINSSKIEQPIPFDFLIDGKFLKTSITSYLDAHSFSTVISTLIDQIRKISWTLSTLNHLCLLSNRLLILMMIGSLLFKCIQKGMLKDHVEFFLIVQPIHFNGML